MTATGAPGPGLPAPLGRTTGLGLPAIGALAALVYLVMIGGTDFGEVLPPLQMSNGIIAGALILAFVAGLQRADRVDRGVLLAFVLFSAAGLLSSFPRQSFDAVLAALAYMAGLFVARDLLSRASVRAAWVRVMIALSFVVTTVMAVTWFGIVLEWWSLPGTTAVPPLGFELPAGAWGHRHDVTLLVTLLYPSWWIVTPSMARRAGAVTIGLMALFVVVLDGSRTLWLATGLASVVVAGPVGVRHWPRSARANWTILGLALLAVVLLVASGLAGALIGRATSLTTLDYRSAMWGSLVEAWLDHPVGGLGPGSFPWVLQMTGYFDANSWAPRHPDSVPFQLLAECGLLGILAVSSLAVVLGPAILRGRSTAALWALLAFAVAGIGASPTDFAYLIVVAIAWTAFTAPRESEGVAAEQTRSARWPRFAILAALGVISVAYASTVAASFVYAGTTTTARAGDISGSESQLSTAVALDPGMPLYLRQRGIARLLDDDVPSATVDLDRAAALNPSDDLAWRALAIARAEAGELDDAIAAAERAMATQRSDPTNLLLAARLAQDAGRDADVLDSVAQLVRAWPEIVAAPGWEAFVNRGNLDVEEVRVTAAARDGRDPTPQSDPILAAVILGTTNSREVSGLERAREASYRCDVAALDLLTTASEGSRRGGRYWEIAIRGSALSGSPDDDAIAVYALLTGRSTELSSTTGRLNPLGQSDFPVKHGLDLWGYRRVPIAWPAYEFELPDPGVGAARWLLEPLEAGRASGVPTCS